MVCSEEALGAAAIALLGTSPPWWPGSSGPLVRPGCPGLLDFVDCSFGGRQGARSLTLELENLIVSHSEILLYFLAL